MSVYPLSKDIPSYKDLAKGDRIGTHSIGWVTVVHKSGNYVIVKLDEPIDGSLTAQLSYNRLKNRVPIKTGDARAVKKKLRDAGARLLSDLRSKYDAAARKAGYSGLGSDFDSIGQFKTWVQKYSEAYGDIGVEYLLRSNDFLFVPDMGNVAGKQPGKKGRCRLVDSCIMPKELVAWFKFVYKPICDVVYKYKWMCYIRYREDGKDVRKYCQFVKSVDDAEAILPYYSDLVCGRFDEIEAKYKGFPELVKYKVEEVKKMVRGMKANDRNVLYDVRMV